MKKIDTVTPYFFEGHLIIALDQSWIKVFKKIPEFETFVDDEKRLHIVSKEVIKQ